MIFSPTPLKGSFIIELDAYSDERGWFARTYDKSEFAKIHHSGEWVQMNQSYTINKGTIRGMHYQESPYKEVKLVRCIRGQIYDVIMDIRKESPTFLQWYGVELSADQMNMIYIPEGFAHGFQTLTDKCELLYNHSSFYIPEAERGIAYNDPLANIIWPQEVSFVSQRDKSHPYISGNFKGLI
jgi:dTDP-4-dehydrorhamnose 3,5-epimerase